MPRRSVAFTGIFELRSDANPSRRSISSVASAWNSGNRETRLRSGFRGWDRCPHSNPQLGGDLAYAELLGAKLGYAIAVKDPLGPMWRKVLSGSAADRLSHPPGAMVLQVPEPSSLGALLISSRSNWAAAPRTWSRNLDAGFRLSVSARWMISRGEVKDRVGTCVCAIRRSG